MCQLVIVSDGFHFKSVKCTSLSTDADLPEKGADLCIEAVLVHAEELRRVAQSDEAGCDVWSHAHIVNERASVEEPEFRSIFERYSQKDIWLT
jgi:hypothetical protein